jgi:Tfp pilus assembly protein PilX
MRGIRGNLRGRLSDERGIAIITALLVSMIIVTLGITSVSIAIHNSEQSSFDRRRVQGIAAAEAGVNYYFSHLQSESSAANFRCGITQTLTGTPATRFVASATYYDAAGAPISCPAGGTLQVSGSTAPSTALIRSEGSTVLNETPTRTMEAYVRLVVHPGSPFGTSVIFSNGSINWGANVTIQGADASNTNVYSNGNISLASSTIVYGSLYAQGSITLSGSAQVRRDTWARGSLTVQNNAAVLGNGQSSTSSITVRNNARIYNNARAGTSITTTTRGIGGTRTPNSPSGPPPAQSLPTFTFDPAPWVEDGYTVQTFTGTSACPNAKAFARNITAGSYVIRIAADCTLSWNRDAPALKGNLAFVTDGAISNGTQTKWGPTAGQTWGLFMFAGIDNDGQPCDITWGAGSGVNPGLSTFLYTPCTISLSSNVYLNEGQMFGGAVTMGANSGIKYKQIGIPGFGTGGFDEDVLYVREVITGS